MREVMLHVLLVVLCCLRSALRSRADLALENLALRQQLSAFVHSRRHPRIRFADRWFWIALRRLWGRWLDVLVFVNPRRSFGGIARGSVATGRGSRFDADQVDRRSIRKLPP